MFKHWYLFVIAGGLLWIVLLINKVNKSKLKYYSQIEINKKLHYMEMNFNPTDTKKVYFKGAKWYVLGEMIRGWKKRDKPEISEKANKIYNSRELRNLENEAIKMEMMNSLKPDFITIEFLVQKNSFLGLIPYGDKSAIRVKIENCNKPNIKRAEINGNLTLIYYNGFFINWDYDLVQTILDDNFRFQSDLNVDASGQQQKDFSRIRTDFAHEEVMTDKTIEAEKEKDKSKSFGNR